MMRQALALSLLALATHVHAQQRLTPQQFTQLVKRCAPHAAPDTMLAIARTESSLAVNALSLNRPNHAARIAGYTNHQIVLARQPRSREEAVRWMQWFVRRKYTVSVGLMQVNIENAHLFHLRPEQLFEPCTNVTVAANLLGDSFSQASRSRGADRQALLDTFSAYNSGSFSQGHHNGYVGNVVRNGAKQ